MDTEDIEEQLEAAVADVKTHKKIYESKICSSLTFSDKTSEISWDFFENEDVKNQLNGLLEKLKNCHDNEEEKAQICELIMQMMKEQLDSCNLTTVGQILDFLDVLLKLMFSGDNMKMSSIVQSENALFNSFFMMMPEHFETDPVKIHLFAKQIYETLSDFNNTFYILSKLLIVDNKLCLYIGCTLFWALYKNFFSTDNLPQKYYKMYKSDKFFKLLPSNEQFENLDPNLQFNLLSLISIYANYILLSDINEDHQVFSDFFPRKKNDDVKKLREWVEQLKTNYEQNRPGGPVKQEVDVLTITNVMEFNLLSVLTEDN